MHTHTHTYTYTRTRTRTRTHTRTRTRAHAHKHTHTRAHAHAHRHTCLSFPSHAHDDRGGAGDMEDCLRVLCPQNRMYDAVHLLAAVAFRCKQVLQWSGKHTTFSLTHFATAPPSDAAVEDWRSAIEQAIEHLKSTYGPAGDPALTLPLYRVRCRMFVWFWREGAGFVRLLPRHPMLCCPRIHAPLTPCSSLRLAWRPSG
jgi:hypothetical protein